jgi:glycine C-acetyltransferase
MEFFFVLLVVYPVYAPKGDIIYRLIPQQHRTVLRKILLFKSLEETKKKLDAGLYKAAEIPEYEVERYKYSG